MEFPLNILTNELETLKETIVATLDVTEFLDILGYELVDIIDLFEEEIENQYEEFKRALR